MKRLIFPSIALLTAFLVASAGFGNNAMQQDPKVVAARAQLQVLTRATQAYAIKNNAEFPQSLADLTKGNPPYVEKKALIDPWGNAYQYSPVGQKNGGLRPDIWTVTPTKETIGNWKKEKKKTDKDK